jgi:hypothetical protein
MGRAGIIGVARSLGRATFQQRNLLERAPLFGLCALKFDTRASSIALRGKFPRRARKGSLLLGSAIALLLGVLILSQTLVLLAEEDRRARAASLATSLSDLAADYDLYVAQNMLNLTAHLNSLGGAAAFMPAGHTATFLGSGWRAPIAGLGMSATPYVVSMAGFDVGLGVAAADSVEGVTGFLLLNLQAGEEPRLLQDVRGALAQKTAEQGRIGLNSADGAGAEVLGGVLSERQLAIASPALADLNDEYVLRTVRIGHEHLTQIKTELTFTSDSFGVPTHSILAADHVAAVSATAQNAVCLGAPHVCVSEAYLRFSKSDPLAALQVTGSVLAADHVNMGSLKVSSGLVSEALSAASTIEVTGQLALDDGGEVNTLAAGRGLVGSLIAQNLQAERASLGEGATISPAVSADQVIARDGGFAQVVTGSCVGC